MRTSSALTLVTTAGTIEVPPRTLLVAVDDTGNEAFPSGTTSFGLGGCAFMAGDYSWLIDEPWRHLKAAHFGGERTQLHAAGLHRVSAQQAEALGDFFRANSFFRYAILATESVEMPLGVPLITGIGTLLMERVLHMVNSIRATGVIVVAEHSQRLNRSISSALAGRRISIDGIESEIPIGFLRKSVGASFLEVADFVVHTAGAQLRNTVERPAQPERRDFKAVFWRVPSHLSHYHVLLRARQMSGRADG